MDLGFVERCKENSKFRGSHRDLFATNVAHEIWVSDWSPAEGVPGDNFVGGRNGAKAKGRK